MGWLIALLIVAYLALGVFLAKRFGPQMLDSRNTDGDAATLAIIVTLFWPLFVIGRAALEFGRWVR